MIPQRFAANVSILFTERPFLERFGAAARAGFRAVELWWPGGEKLDDVGRRPCARPACRSCSSTSTPATWRRASAVS